MDTGAGWHTVVVLGLAALGMVAAAGLVAMAAEWGCKALEEARREGGARGRARQAAPHPDADVEAGR